MPKGIIIFKDKQTRILMLLKNESQRWNITALAQTANTTYVHTHNFISECESLGFTTSERHGRLKLIKLTERGMQLTNMITSIYGLMEQKQEQKPEQKSEQKKPSPAQT